MFFTKPKNRGNIKVQEKWFPTVSKINYKCGVKNGSQNHSWG